MYSKKKMLIDASSKIDFLNSAFFYNNDKGSKVFWLIKSIGNTDWNKR